VTGCPIWKIPIKNRTYLVPGRTSELRGPSGSDPKEWFVKDLDGMYVLVYYM
jgi:hypothetical protein